MTLRGAISIFLCRRAPYPARRSGTDLNVLKNKLIRQDGQVAEWQTR